MLSFLCQAISGKQKIRYIPLQVFSRRLDKSQRNYTPLDLELMSVCLAIMSWSDLLITTEIILVVCNNKDVCYLINSTQTSPSLQKPRIARCLAVLNSYNCKSHYIPTRDNVFCYILSRLHNNREEVIPAFQPTPNPGMEQFAN